MLLQFYSMLASPSSITLEVRAMFFELCDHDGQALVNELCCVVTALVRTNTLILPKTHILCMFYCFKIWPLLNINCKSK